MASAHQPAFESAGELRQAHGRLLEQVDALLEQDPSPAGQKAALIELEPAISSFLDRGAATGVFLEEIADRTTCQVLLDYWVSSLASAGKRRGSARLARFDGEQLPDLKDKTCPYVGLEAFHDETYFFGRERDTEALLEQVRSTDLVVLIGASGSGKSSLMLGGLLPRLERRGEWRIAPPLLPGNRLFDHLAEAVAAIAGIGGDAVAELAGRLREDPGHLASVLADPERPPSVIAVDQFEEVFTLASQAEREGLVASLATLLGAGRGHRVVVSVREEFRSRIVGLRAFEPFLERAWYSMRPMGYEELRAAVLEPAALVNLRFQPGVVDDLVKKVLGQAAALPLLQFTLRELWEHRDRNRVTWEVYRKVGGPLDALETSAEGFYAGLAPQTREEAKRILLELVWVDDLLEAYRQPVPKRQLLAAGKANTEEVLELLVDHDYVRSTAGASAADAVLDLKHEALIRNWPRFVSWIDQKRIVRRQRLTFTQAAQRWVDSDRRPDTLLTGWQLDEAKSYEDLSESEREFVETSAAAVQQAQREKELRLEREAEQARALARREKRLRRRTTALLVVTGIVALVIAWSAVHFYKKSRDLTRQFALLQQEQRTLENEFAQLASEQRQLQEDYDELFAKQVESSVALESAEPTRRPVTIYLHISEEEQRPRAEEIKLKLEASNIQVPGIEKVDPVSASDVRYFRPEDERGAQEIVRLLEEYLLGAGGAVRPKFIPGFEAVVPERRYEIWFGSSAFAVAPQRLAGYKIDIYYDEASEDDRLLARRIKNGITRVAKAVVLVPRGREFLKGAGKPFGPEIRYDPGLEDQVAAELQQVLRRLDPSVKFELRRVGGKRTPGTVSIFLFSG